MVVLQHSSSNARTSKWGGRTANVRQTSFKLFSLFLFYHLSTLLIVFFFSCFLHLLFTPFFFLIFFLNLHFYFNFSNLSSIYLSIFFQSKNGHTQRVERYASDNVHPNKKKIVFCFYSSLDKNIWFFFIACKTKRVWSDFVFSCRWTKNNLSFFILWEGSRQRKEVVSGDQ